MSLIKIIFVIILLIFWRQILSVILVLLKYILIGGGILGLLIFII